MATRKAIYVDSNGDYIESAGVYEAADHINSSAGAGDAGKPIVLDAAGHIDASMINDADIDHGSIGGLSTTTIRSISCCWNTRIHWRSVNGQQQNNKPISRHFRHRRG